MSGVAHQNVELAKLRHRLVDRALAELERGEVALHDEAPASLSFDGLPRPTFKLHFGVRVPIDLDVLDAKNDHVRITDDEYVAEFLARGLALRIRIAPQRQK